MLIKPLGLMVLTLLLSAPVSAAIYGASYSKLYSIDESTGEATNIGCYVEGCTNIGMAGLIALSISGLLTVISRYLAS